MPIWKGLASKSETGFKDMQNYAEPKTTVKLWMYEHDIGQKRGEQL